MKTKKYILSFLIFIFMFLSFTSVFVKGETIKTTNLINIEDVTLTSEFGLKVTLKIDSNDYNIKSYGLLFGYGKTSDKETLVKNGYVNNHSVLNGEVDHTYNGLYTVTITNIPKENYLEDITIRSYFETKIDTYYSNTLSYINPFKVALKYKNQGKESKEAQDIINYVDQNYVVTEINNKGNFSLSTSLLDKNRISLYQEFINDYKEYFDIDISKYSQDELFNELKSDSIDNLVNSNLYKFFNNEILNKKWIWLIKYFYECKELEDLVIQADYIINKSTHNDTRLHFGDDLIYSIYNFFNGTHERGHFFSLSFTNPNRYDEATKESNVYINIDNKTLVKVGESINLPNKPSNRDGYKFISFKVKDINYYPNEVYKIYNKDVEFVPDYELINYNINYYYNGELIETTNPIKYNIETEDIILEPVKREGYSFEGWFLDKDFTQKIESIPKGSFNDLNLYLKLVEISDRIEKTNKYLIDEFTNLGTITRNITLPTYYEKEETSITWTSQNPEILTDTGKLKRDYKESIVTMQALIKCGDKERIYTYNLKVAGFKPLVNIASSYIYTNYGKVTDTFFDTLDIINCAFVKGNADGTLTGSNFFNNVKRNIIDRAHEQGIYVIASIAPDSSWKVIANPGNNIISKFSDNIVKMINEYGFDGVDIDWEYPHRGEYTWFTSLLKEVNEKVKANNPNHLVTAAIGGGKWQPNYYDLNNSKYYLDYINLMCYSMVNNNGYYQNALYPSTSYNDSSKKVGRTMGSCSIHESVRYYKNNFNISPDKLIAGFSFYAIVQEKVNNTWEFSYNTSFTDIHNNYQNNPNYIEVYDNIAKVPYIISKDGNTFISYDNTKSIIDKSKYAIDNNLAGLMYWQNGQDTTDTLLKALKVGLNK